MSHGARRKRANRTRGLGIQGNSLSKGNIKLFPITNDESSIDTNNIESLKQYCVIPHSIEANTEIRLPLIFNTAVWSTLKVRKQELKV